MNVEDEYRKFAAAYCIPPELYFVAARGRFFVRGSFAKDPAQHIGACRMAIDFDRRWEAWQRRASFDRLSPPRELLERLAKNYTGRRGWDALEPDRLNAVDELRTWLEQNP